jgi:hypothetical protein
MEASVCSAWKNSFIVMLHPIEVLHEAFSYERYTMGDVGRNYSAQWRSYKGEAIAYNSDNNSFIYERHDQIKELIADMRENIMSTRLKLPHGIQGKKNSASSMSRQFPSHRSSFVSINDRSSRKEQTNISKQMKREELIKWVFRVRI